MLEVVTHREFGVDGIMIAPAFFFMGDIPRGFQFGNNFLYAPLAEFRLSRYLFGCTFRIVEQVDQNSSMIGKKCPFPFFQLNTSNIIDVASISLYNYEQ